VRKVSAVNDKPRLLVVVQEGLAEAVMEGGGLADEAFYRTGESV